MRLYTSVLLSSLLLMSTAVRAQSMEPTSLLKSGGDTVRELLIIQANIQAAQTDSDVSPERGSGR